MKCSRTRAICLLVLSGFTSLLLSIGIDQSEAQENPEAVAQPDIQTQVAQLRQTCLESVAQIGSLQQQVSWLSQTSPPVGTIMAYSGVWPPKKTDMEAWTEADLGWMLCDGRAATGPEFTQLRLVLGSDTLPDYRGYFLRGCDMSPFNGPANRDPNHDLGQQQQDTTRLPRSDFLTEANSGQHYHYGSTHGRECKSLMFYDGNETIASPRDGHPPETREPNLLFCADMTDGPHEHRINRGGDSETRPINIAVHWIIKFK